MARRHNIDLRRKRIRHYTARRRRRSPLRRAFLFWWSAGLLTGIILLFLAKLTLYSLLSPIGRRPVAEYQVPPPGLRLLSIPAEVVEERLRMGKVRRAAIAMQDDEIGISLALKLPEPAPLKVSPLPPLALPDHATRPETTITYHYLPPLTEPVAAVPTVHTMVRPSRALTEAGLTFKEKLPSPPPGVVSGRADFRLKANDDGRIEFALRTAPKGEETAWLRTLRTFLISGTTEGATEGTITLYWTNEEAHK